MNGRFSSHVFIYTHDIENLPRNILSTLIFSLAWLLPLMGSTGDDREKHLINSELYDALMIREDEKRVIDLCRKIPDHALHILTVHDDSLLHIATYSKRSDLVMKLLEELPEQYLDKMTRQNTAGNTILHETATSNHALPIADKVLKKAPGLLGMRNNNGETALFRAARYGKADIFNFLSGKICNYDQASKLPFLQRTDKTTVLHIAILSQHFGLALQIAKEYKFLIGEQDVDGMTSLQLLSVKPEAFHRKHEDGFLEKLINYVKFSCILSSRQTVQMEKQQYESAMELAKFLIERDTSWELTYPVQDQGRPKIHKYGRSNIEKGITEGTSTNIAASPAGYNEAETPLFLATQSGCLQIVKEILKTYPQAVEHIDDEGRNILHVAIKYRQLEIFELVKEKEAPMRRLVRKIDNNGNTMLHMVGVKRKDFVPEKMEGPALVLQEELHWYQRVKDISLPHFLNHQNNMRLTAEALFASANVDLRLTSKEWLKHTTEGCSLVAILIATVAFAAAYTVPGGSNESTGYPVLINEPFFVVFTVSDVLSLTFSLASVVMFLSILTSPFRLEDFKNSLPNKMNVGFTFLFLSVCLMMVAFAATILLMIKNKENWAKIVLYTCSLIPVAIFSLSYFPVYVGTSITRGCKYLSNKGKQLIPRSFQALLKDSSRFSKSSSPSIPY